MKIIILIVITIVVAIAFFFIGSLLGNLFARGKKKQKDVKRNGNAHV